MSKRQIFNVPGVERRAFMAADYRVGSPMLFLMMRVVLLAITTVIFTCAPYAKVWAKDVPGTSASRKPETLSKPDPKELIGREVSRADSVGGWKATQTGRMYDEYGYATYQNGAAHVLALRKWVSGGTKDEPLARHIVLDAVSLKGRPRNKSIWYDLVSDCRGPGVPHEMDLRVREQVILAEVIFKKCTRYSSNILSAWLVDQRKGVIEPMSTNGMRCGNTFLDSGIFTECKFIPRAW